MSTNANINVKVGDKFHSVYLHWDGYPSAALKTLKENYATQELAELLVSHGDMSILAEKSEPDPKDNEHSFEHPQEGVSVYYGRDRGEDNVDMIIGDKPDGGQEYNYLFAEGKWGFVAHYIVD